MAFDAHCTIFYTQQPTSNGGGTVEEIHLGGGECWGKGNTIIFGAIKLEEDKKLNFNQ
jgi:hypothetical protein